MLAKNGEYAFSAGRTRRGTVTLHRINAAMRGPIRIASTAPASPGAPIVDLLSPSMTIRGAERQGFTR